MDYRFFRTQMLIGEESCKKLSSSKIALFGVGGVGSYTAEALVRAGVINISVFDRDTVDITNINRQIHALTSTVGEYKVTAIKKRMLDINPQANIRTNICFYCKENSSEYDLSEYDYIIDAIDTVSSKIELICKAKENKKRIISCMGTGNKIHPLSFEIDDIYNTSVCPLARVMRYELKKRKIKSLKVLYSKEIPVKTNIYNKSLKPVPGSISFVPSVAGLIIAGEVVNDLIKN